MKYSPRIEGKLTIVDVSYKYCSVTSKALQCLSILTVVPVAMHITNDGQADETGAPICEHEKKHEHSAYGAPQMQACYGLKSGFLLHILTEGQTEHIEDKAMQAEEEAVIVGASP